MNDIDAGIGDIMEDTGTNNQVAPSHGVLSCYLIIVFDVGRMP